MKFYNLGHKTFETDFCTEFKYDVSFSFFSFSNAPWDFHVSVGFRSKFELIFCLVLSTF